MVTQQINSKSTVGLAGPRYELALTLEVTDPWKPGTRADLVDRIERLAVAAVSTINAEAAARGHAAIAEDPQVPGPGAGCVSPLRPR